MGMVFGKINVETPKYTVAAKETDFEIREYEPWLIAETSYDPRQEKEGKAFMVLAGYIGALGKPLNFKASTDKGGKAEKIAMTAPVITYEKQGEPRTTEDRKADGEGGEGGEKIAMTAPVVTAETAGLTSMQFVLPSTYNLGNAPKPIDERVSIREIPSQKFGVITFSGVADQQLIEKKRERLRKALQDAGYTITGDFVVARYNPPWTISFLRTNEVFLPVA